MDPEAARKLRERLHDGLCQQLTAALMFADALRRNLSQREAPEQADCELLVQLLQQSADELVAIMDSASDYAEQSPSLPPPGP